MSRVTWLGTLLPSTQFNIGFQETHNTAQGCSLLWVFLSLSRGNCFESIVNTPYCMFVYSQVVTLFLSNMVQSTDWYMNMIKHCSVCFWIDSDFHSIFIQYWSCQKLLKLIWFNWAQRRAIYCQYLLIHTQFMFAV